MKNIFRKLIIFFSILWCVYFFYSIALSVYDLTTVKRVDWRGAENVSKIYSGYKASIVTWSFRKNNKKVSRKYGALFEGVNVYLWGVNKRADTLNISFYVKDNFFEKMIHNSSNDNYPFFGLRKLGKSSSPTFLFLDIWKYNYSNGIGTIVFFCPLIIVFLLKSVKKKIQFKVEEINDLYNAKLTILFIFLFFLNMII